MFFLGFSEFLEEKLLILGGIKWSIGRKQEEWSNNHHNTNTKIRSETLIFVLHERSIRPTGLIPKCWWPISWIWQWNSDLPLIPKKFDDPFLIVECAGITSCLDLPRQSWASITPIMAILILSWEYGVLEESMFFCSTIDKQNLAWVSLWIDQRDLWWWVWNQYLRSIDQRWVLIKRVKWKYEMQLYYQYGWSSKIVWYEVQKQKLLQYQHTWRG